MNIAIIPARGGSKRIPRKNIKNFFGKPMIGYAIEVAQESKLFEHIVVSTDDEEIAEVARQFGAEVPFLRPKNLADDLTATVPVVAHAIEVCQAQWADIKYVCCIYPCVPFLRADDLRGALDRLIRSGDDYCFPVAEYSSPIQRALRIMEGGKVQPFYPEHEDSRTQDLEKSYFDAGQFYWGLLNSWVQNSKLDAKIHSRGAGYPIPTWRVVDIDTPEDWIRAEINAQKLLGNIQ